MKKSGKKITILTCYDASFARLLESIEVDAILVGDSLGMFIKGEANTHDVSLSDMIYHTKAVSRGTKSSFIISDLPINTYETNDLAFKSALALIEAGAHMVKLEGGASLAPIVTHLKTKDIKVCGHIGYMPQSIKNMNSNEIQRALEKTLGTIIEDAKALEKSGADMLVLSSVPEDVAKRITQEISIPTIGFHSGGTCDGDVFILYDLLMNSNTSQDLYLDNTASSNKNTDIKNLLLEFIKNRS
ncbi:MAG: 3-methyl-2-oxobutanoate hydroxymethyltransferase [Candidatus Methylopumilus sp.]|nr:3-methyl-2-oxobutanoate hydroxymethyltransferase [Candidatus Methylopumilus sp.]